MSRKACFEHDVHLKGILPRRLSICRFLGKRMRNCALSCIKVYGMFFYYCYQRVAISLSINARRLRLVEQPQHRHDMLVERWSTQYLVESPNDVPSLGNLLLFHVHLPVFVSTYYSSSRHVEKHLRLLYVTFDHSFKQLFNYL